MFSPQPFTPILFIILDGLADRPQAVLGGKTPLEAAHTPHLDRLAGLGATGQLIPLAPGVPLESETAHFILFGYPPEQFPGRAAFEAIGRGIQIGAESVILLASFATATLAALRKKIETLYRLRITADYAALPVSLEKAEFGLNVVQELFQLITRHTGRTL